MFRLVDTQWIKPATLGSVLMKVTSQQTLALVLTIKLVLLVVSVAEEPVPDSVSEYYCPLTAERWVNPQLSSVCSCADSVPFSGAPLRWLRWRRLGCSPRSYGMQHGVTAHDTRSNNSGSRE